MTKLTHVTFGPDRMEKLNVYICTFNCADRQKPEWEPLAKKIMASLKANS